MTLFLSQGSSRPHFWTLSSSQPPQYFHANHSGAMSPYVFFDAGRLKLLPNAFFSQPFTNRSFISCRSPSRPWKRQIFFFGWFFFFLLCAKDSRFCIPPPTPIIPQAAFWKREPNHVCDLPIGSTRWPFPLREPASHIILQGDRPGFGILFFCVKRFPDQVAVFSYFWVERLLHCHTAF